MAPPSQLAGGAALLLLGAAAPSTQPACCAPARPQIYRRALPGLNSAAVGLIVASVFQLSLNAYATSPFPHASICIGILAYGATEVLNTPAPFVVIGGGVLGVIAHYTHMH